MNKSVKGEKGARGDGVAVAIHPLTTYGGAEYELKVIMSCYPRATIVTAWYDPDLYEKHFSQYKIKTSFLHWFPYKRQLSRILIPLLPFAYRTISMRGFRYIHILSDGFEKGVRKPQGSKSILNIMTPPRFLWMDESRSGARSGEFLFTLYDKFLSHFLHAAWRRFDIKAVGRADIVLAISQEVQSRVAKMYNTHADVLYPPVEVSQFKFQPEIEKREDFYLYIGRVESYKGVELAIRAAIMRQERLIVAGDGADRARLEQLADDLGGSQYVRFLGFITEDQKVDLYYRCKALIYPVRDEDFGIVPIEANASGAPVIAFRSGGVKETIIDGVTGVFFDEHNVQSLADSMNRLATIGINPQNCADQAENFSRDRFESKLVTWMNALKKR